MSSPRFEPLFLAGSGVSGDEAAAASAPELPEPLVSPTSTLQAAAAASPTSPAATCRGSTLAAPFSRDLSSGGGRRSRSHRRPWEARVPVGLGLAGALNGEAPVAAATTTVLLTGQRRLRPVHHTTNAPSCPRRCPSPREMVEASEDNTRVIARGPNLRTTHIFDDRVVVDEDSCGLSLSAAREGSGEEDGFLRWCHGCSKDLGEGKDIFMYRGEMAFCSHECRYREMLLHEKL